MIRSLIVRLAFRGADCLKPKQRAWGFVPSQLRDVIRPLRRCLPRLATGTALTSRAGESWPALFGGSRA